MYDVSLGGFPAIALQTQSKAFEVFIYSGCNASTFTFDNTATLLTIKHYVGSTIQKTTDFRQYIPDEVSSLGGGDGFT